MEAIDQRESKAEYQQQFETITSPERIYSLLKSAVDVESSIKIVPDNSGEMFQTSFVDVDDERKTLFLREIDYTFGHLMVIDSKYLNIYFQHDGAEVSFRTHLNRYSERDGGYYQTNFPDQLKYCQRRTNYRVHTSYTLGIKVEFYMDNGQKVEGYLRDISSNGLRLHLLDIDPDAFQQNTLIKNCEISIPEREAINCTLLIRHKHLHVRNNRCTVGGSFVQMNTQQKRDIQKFIAGLERQLLRNVRA